MKQTTTTQELPEMLWISMEYFGAWNNEKGRQNRESAGIEVRDFTTGGDIHKIIIDRQITIEQAKALRKKEHFTRSVTSNRNFHEVTYLANMSREDFEGALA